MSKSAVKTRALARMEPEEWWRKTAEILCQKMLISGVSEVRIWRDGSKFCFEITPETQGENR